MKDLQIGGNPVTDKFVMILKDIPELQRVGLTGTKVSEPVALALKRVRPELTVEDRTGTVLELEKQPELPAKPTTEDLSKVAPAFKLTAAEFCQEFEAGRNTAAAKYKDKVIELSGTVAFTSRPRPGQAVVGLMQGQSMWGAWCFTVDAQPWSKVLSGQKIRIKGKYPGSTIHPTLVDCVFVDTGKYNAILVTARQLASEYAADPRRTVEKYDDKHLIVTGEVVSKEYNSAAVASIELKTGNKVKVICNFKDDENEVIKAIEVGQTIKALGDFALNFPGLDNVTLYLCQPLLSP